MIGQKQPLARYADTGRSKRKIDRNNAGAAQAMTPTITLDALNNAVAESPGANPRA